MNTHLRKRIGGAGCQKLFVYKKACERRGLSTPLRISTRAISFSRVLLAVLDHCCFQSADNADRGDDWFGAGGSYGDRRRGKGSCSRDRREGLMGRGMVQLIVLMGRGNDSGVGERVWRCEWLRRRC